MNTLVDFVCEVYGLSYNELADKLGVNRGWFTRYRNGSFLDWGAQTVFDIAYMVLKMEPETLFAWLFVEDAKIE